MQPEAQAAMRTALERGPDFVPEGLFAGSRRAHLRALKAYANTISHARHVALEDSFPRTRELLGPERFHAIARLHLSLRPTLERSLRHIGAGFSTLVDDAAAADLADLEWAMLLAHGAADSPALTLDRIKDRAPEELVEVVVNRHPTTHIVELRKPAELALEGLAKGNGDRVLVTRPKEEIRLALVTEAEAHLLKLAEHPIALGILLDRDAEAATILVTTGALRLQRIAFSQ